MTNKTCSLTSPQVKSMSMYRRTDEGEEFKMNLRKKGNQRGPALQSSEWGRNYWGEMMSGVYELNELRNNQRGTAALLKSIISNLDL